MSPDSPTPSRSRRAWRAMSAAGVLLASLSILSSVVLWRRADIEQDAARQYTLERICQEANERHDETIVTLDRLVTEIPDPRRRARAAASKRFTVELIESLAPREDCARRARTLVRPDSTR